MTTATSNATTNVSNNLTHTNIFNNGNSNNNNGNGANTIDREVASEQNHTPKELNVRENAQNIGSNGAANNLRGADIGKRKKLKSRNIPTADAGYDKDHLDAWLETCLKDVSPEQLSSSSEFLDYNPIPTRATTNVGNKQNPTMSALNHNTSGQQTNFGNASQAAQPQQPGLPQNQMNIRSNGKTAPILGGYTAPFSQSFQRSMPNFMKPLSGAYQTNRFSTMFPASPGGLYGQMNDSSQDFASLPPILNLLGNYGGNNGASGNGAGSSEHENNSTDVLDGSGSNPNISRGFRFSDPCLLNPSDNDSKISERNTPERRQQMTSEMENNKFFVALMEQINILHETNSKICRNLHETKVDIEALKHAPTWGMRHRRDSLSGLSAHSQPMIFGGGFGTQSPAPTYHSGAYTPGMMTDVVREVKEAARVREDALLNRVKALVEERQWSMNEANLRMMRDIEELKSQISFLRSDRKEANRRINHLEAENKYMRQLLANIYNTNRSNFSTTIYENEKQQQQQQQQKPQQRQRKNLSHGNARRSQSLNLHYGTVHHQATSSLSLEEQDEEPLHIIEQPIMQNTDYAELKHQKTNSNNEMRSSFSSSEGSNGVASVADNVGLNKLSMSPPKFALITTPATNEQQPKNQQQQQQVQKPKRKSKENVLKKISTEELKQKIHQTQPTQQTQQTQQMRRPSTDSVKTVSTQELQRELSDAHVARQNAEERIIAIEKLVQNLHVNSTQPMQNAILNVDGGGHGDGDGDGAGIYNNSTTTIHMHHNSKAQSQPINVSCSSNKQNSNAKILKQEYQQVTKPATPSMGSNNTPRLSVAGPITDL